MRKFSIILLILVLAFVSGCSSTSVTTPAANTPTAQNNSTAGQENTSSNDQGQNQNQSQMPDLLGKITAIDQNTVEVAELKMPEGMQGGFSAGQRPDGAPGAGTDQANMTDQERQELKQKMEESRPAEAGQGDPGQGEPGRRGNVAMNYEETGKSYKLLIAADTAISERQMGKDGNSESTLTVKDLQEGDILRIWVEQLNADGESKVLRAELMPVREISSN